MQEINKPKFKFSTFEKAATIFGILSTIFASYFIIWYIPVIIFLLLFLLLLIYNIHEYKKQTENLYSIYSTLNNRYKQRMSEIKKKQLIIDEYENMLDNLNIILLTSLTTNSSKETQQIQNIQSFLLQSTEHISKINGGNH